MITRKLILLTALALFLGCSAPKTGMEYIELDHGRTKVIDYDNHKIHYLDHNGRVYMKVKWEDYNEG
jgi:hypothetical protein